MRALGKGAFSKTFSWTAAGAAVSLAFLPLMAKYFSPEAFGSLALVLTLSNTLVPLITFRYEQALLKIRSRRLYRAAVWSVLTCVLISSTILSFIVILLIKFKWTVAANTIIYAIVMSVAMSLYHLLDKHFTASRMVEMVGRQFFIRNVLVSVVPVGAVVVGMPGEGAIVGYTLLGILVTLSCSVIALVLDPKSQFMPLSTPHINEMYVVFRRYWRLPAYNMPHALLTNLIVMVPQYFITIKFGLSIGGVFSVAMRGLNAPSALVNHAALAVNTAILRDRLSTREGNRLLIKKSVLRALGMTFGWVCLVAISPDLVLHYFGADWSQLPMTLLALSPCLFMVLVCGPLATVPILFSEERIALFFEVVGLVLKLGAMFVGSKFGFIWCVFGFSLGTSIWGIILFGWYWRLLITNTRA